MGTVAPWVGRGELLRRSPVLGSSTPARLHGRCKRSRTSRGWFASEGLSRWMEEFTEPADLLYAFAFCRRKTFNGERTIRSICNLLGTTSRALLGYGTWISALSLAMRNWIMPLSLGLVIPQPTLKGFHSWVRIGSWLLTPMVTWKLLAGWEPLLGWSRDAYRRIILPIEPMSA